MYDDLYFDGTPPSAIDCRRSRKMYLAVKKVFDVTAGLIGCAFTVLVLGIVKAGYVMAGDRGKIIYRQERTGKGGHPFVMYKIRTMREDADDMLKELLKEEVRRTEWEKTQKLENDPRVTRLGRILRKYSVDEMPQFFNVLKGEMSVVGPRPLLPGELRAHNGHPLYNSVLPGITGWWACRGEPGMDYEKRLKIEYEYIKNMSIRMDMKCIVMTAGVMFRGKNKGN